MIHDPLIAAPLTHVAAQPPAPAPGAHLPAPTAEQVRAADGVFTSPHEGQKVLGMLGMWTGVLLLHDLALEHFEGREDDEELPPEPDPDADPPAP